jgi:hypothetical protein
MNHRLIRTNKTIARKIWGELSPFARRELEALTQRFLFSVASGDLILLNGHWYVTHSGLVHLAARKNCSGITASPLMPFCNSALNQWAFKATVYKSRDPRGFVGYGDANPSNVSTLVYGAEMRVAETRAVNRALRKAYGIGICSVEEIGSLTALPPSSREAKHEIKKAATQPVNGKGNGNGSRVRDRLCQIIRQHQLDATLVKSYAVDFCGTKTLREASREQVENFVVHLADWAEKDRNALLCQLNSYSQAGAA